MAALGEAEGRAEVELKGWSCSLFVALSHGGAVQITGFRTMCTKEMLNRISVTLPDPLSVHELGHKPGLS